MMRFETNEAGGQNNAEDLRKIIRQEAKKLRPVKVVKRPFFSCCNCFLVVLLVLIILGIFGAAALARSGIREIPVLTPLLYHQPQPSHLVTPRTENNFSFTTGQQPTGLKPGEKQVVLREEYLTYLIQERLRQFGSGWLNLRADSAQVAIDQTQLEIFAQVLSPFNSYLTLGILPILTNGQISLKIQSLKIGDLSLPVGWGEKLFDQTITQQLNSSLANLPVKLDGLALQNGQLVLYFISP